ncbi:MAG: PilW family protein [Gallionella sp.]
MKNSYSQRGVTLIELMIGLVLGLIASLAIFTTISTFEKQRTTTGSGANMQQNGLLALYSIEQDMRMAGFGLINSATNPGTLPCAKLNDRDISPVHITDGGTGSDAITSHRLDSDIGGMVTGGAAAKLTSDPVANPITVSNLTVDTNASIHLNDYLLISHVSKNCTGFKATTLPSITASTVGPPPAAAPSYGTVINLGQLPPGQTTPAIPSLQYKLDASHNLIHTADGGTSWNTVASNIVDMQMQYGVANTGSQSVTCWTDATGSACAGTDWANPIAAEVLRIKAIRIALVARSAQKDNKVDATGACSTTPAAPISWVQPTTTPTSSAAPVIDLSATVGADWACYRYKVYQTVIPLRNVIWGNL